MLQQVRVSVGRTWGLRTDDGRATVVRDKTGYRNLFNQLKAGNAPDAFGFPWPRYRSTFWQAMFAGPYQDIASYSLVAGLVPTWLEQAVGSAVPGTKESPWLEIFCHPFAISTVCHLDLDDARFTDEPSAAQALDDLLRQPLATSTGRQVRDGADAFAVVAPATLDVDGKSAAFEQKGRFILLSGLHQEAGDPLALAASLASLFQSPGSGQPMNTTASGVAVSGDNAAMVLPRNMVRAGGRLSCLHHNQAVLLALMQNLASLVGPPPTVAAEWFQTQAAVVLNHFYWRNPMAQTSGIYRSRLAELWIKRRQLGPALNALTRGATDPVPPIPVA